MQKKLSFLAGALLCGMAMATAQVKVEQYANIPPAELVTKKELTERDLEGMVRYIRVTQKDEKKAAELETLLVKQHPKGAYARQVAYRRIMGINNVEERIAAQEAFLARFPKSEWNNNPRGQEFIYYGTYRTIGADYFETRQFAKLLALQPQLNFKEENEIFRWNVIRAYVFKRLGYDTLYQVTTPMIKDLIAKQNDSSYVDDGNFTPQTAMENAREQLDNELTIYIQLLNSLEKYAEAYSYFPALSYKGRYGNAELNDIELAILEKLGKKEEMRTFLEKAVGANAMTENLYSKLKSLYQQTHASLEGYDAYLASLRSEDEQKLMRAHVKEHLTNEEYKPFAVESAEGEIVRSSEWGNKIVVIDFWATWCKPCIQALPGMQMLVDKYSKDDNVAIYCMGTMQSGDYKNKSVNYVKGQGLVRLHLLHDAVNSETGEQDAVFRSFVPFFHSSAIPRKVVLKDGIMRYSSEGYSGSPSKLVDELSYVIEQLKAEK